MNYARDVLITRDKEGQLYCTDFLVHFKPSVQLPRWFNKRPSTAGSFTSINPRPTTPTALQPPIRPVAANLPAPLAMRLSQSSLNMTLAPATTLPTKPPLSPRSGPPAHDFFTSEPIRPISSAPDLTHLVNSHPIVSLHPRARVDVCVHGQLVPALQMIVDGKGFCQFLATNSAQPPTNVLSTLQLNAGSNPVSFCLKLAVGTSVVQASLYVWDSDDKIAVTDIDGTITKSDVIGSTLHGYHVTPPSLLPHQSSDSYIDTVQLGKYDYTHAGICRLYTQLEREHQVRFIYLTARPISLLEATKNYIAKCEQDGHRLPAGPIFTHTDSFTRVLYQELIEKTIRHFKAHTLMNISQIFRRAGRDMDRSVFLFGFGNKISDAQAYSAAGMKPDNVFLINPSSDIRVFGQERQEENTMYGSRSGDEDRPETPRAKTRREEVRDRLEKLQIAEDYVPIRADSSAPTTPQNSIRSKSPRSVSNTSTPSRGSPWRMALRRSPSRARSKGPIFVSYADEKLLDLLRVRLQELVVEHEVKQEIVREEGKKESEAVAQEKLS